MFYYMTLIWNPESTDQAAFATKKKLELINRKEPNWQVALEVSGMVVLYHTFGITKPYEIHNLPDGKGVVIGKLFKRSYISKLSSEHLPDPVIFDRRLSDSIVNSDGKLLITDFWGGYIAFLNSPERDKRWIVRDPTGEIPCQHACLEGIHAYFIRLEDYEQLNPGRLTLNQHFIEGYLIFMSMARRETGLSEITTILPGECAHHAGDAMSISFYWDPIEISMDNPVDDFESAVEQVRYTLRSCVHAWSSCFNGISISLSGGLDSSIVLTCLNDAPSKPRIICRNYFTEDGPNADERRYARLAARKSNATLLEIPATEEINDEIDSSKIRSLYPPGWPLNLSGHFREERKLADMGVSAEFYGDGGDELFARLQSLPASVDLAWKKGLSTNLLRTVLDDCKLRSLSFIKTFRVANKYGIKRSPWHMKYSYKIKNFPLIRKEIFNSSLRDKTHWHPLYQPISPIPPMKYEHSFVLVYGLGGTHSGISLAPPITGRSPLRSQPLLELCMKIPVETHQKGGRDRMVARSAFRVDLPDEIYRRKSKSFGTHRARNLLADRSEDVKKNLLNGYLLEHGYLDREAIIDSLSKSITASQAETLPILDVMSAEMWIRGLQ